MFYADCSGFVTILAVALNLCQLVNVTKLCEQLSSPPSCTGAAQVDTCERMGRTTMLLSGRKMEA
jgi:hypothetical protein